MAKTKSDTIVMGEEELSLYHALIGHYLALRKTYSSSDQIDTLFPEEEPVPTLSIKLVPWGTGTDEEIGAMIDGYYSGDLTLEQIQSVWHVGDAREINIDEIARSDSYVGEPHTAQTIEIEILDFEHDELVTSTNEKNNSLLTVDLKICLSNSAGSNELEGGAMHSSNIASGWENCDRRNWCNEIFYNVLPEYIKNRIKQVNKYRSAGGQNSTINTTQDYCFILSEVEVFGTNSYSWEGEGTQYSYYNINNKNKTAANGVSTSWWLCSPCKGRTSGICEVNNNGECSYADAPASLGLVPAFCL